MPPSPGDDRELPGTKSSNLAAVLFEHRELGLACQHEQQLVAGTVELPGRAAGRNSGAGARGEQFVTGIFLRIRLSDGHVALVNAGHPTPYLVRDGQPVVLDTRTELPLGVAPDPYGEQSMQLQAGDRLLLITDGYLERNTARVDIDAVLVGTLGRHPRQVVQELARNILDATGRRLRDDATTVCIDWYGPAGIRDATAGASLARTTPQ